MRKIVYETKIENIESKIVGNKKFEIAYVYEKQLLEKEME